MKKTLAALLPVALLASSLAACSGGASSGAAAGTSVKTGLAVITAIDSSKDAGDADGLAQVDSTVVAVTVGADGKLAKVAIDSVQTKIAIGKDGKIATPLDTVVESKDELGEGYGMKGKSGLGKEWNEQAQAFADYAVGKTVADLKGIALDEEGHATDTDVTASTTISVGDFIDAIEKAASNAQDLGAKADDKLGLGIVTNIASSKDAGDKDGVAQAYSEYSVITLGADGKITSAITDASQTNVNFSKEGKITTDLASAFKTKDELGADYGMKGQSGIGKEWNEQAKGFSDYIKGKTPDEVKGIAVDEEGHPTASDLTSSTTIGIVDFQEAVQKAASTAK